MFENLKKSLGELDADETQALIRTFLSGNVWEDYYDEDTKPPIWVLEWSKCWKVDFLWAMDLGEFSAKGYLIRDESNGEAWFSDLDFFEQSGFEMISIVTGVLTVNDVCNYNLDYYWAEILGDSVLFGDLRLGDLKWLPMERVKSCIESLMKKHGMDRMGELTLDEWLQREYEKNKKTQ